MWFLPISILVVTTILAIPLSRYLAWIMDGKYRRRAASLVRGSPQQRCAQNWKQYVASLLIFNTVLFVFGFIVLALQPWMPLNDRRGHARTVRDLSHRRLVHDEHGRAALLGRAAFFEFQSAILRYRNFFLSASIGFCESDGNHPCAARRPDSRQLLCRYVASGDLHVSAGSLAVWRFCFCNRAAR